MSSSCVGAMPADIECLQGPFGDYPVSESVQDGRNVNEESRGASVYVSIYLCMPTSLQQFVCDFIMPKKWNLNQMSDSLCKAK